MSSSKASPSTGTTRAPKRALPPWMSVRDDDNGDKQVDDRHDDDDDDDNQVETNQKTARGRGKGVSSSGEESENRENSDFSKLMEGVVLLLSGFVNPERGILRSQALEMGAQYQQDWNSNCTLLVCAFPNTPKFRQVEADGGTIVKKDWITECYTQKKLVDIETYLMRVGKPWRKSSINHTGNKVSETFQANKSHKQETKQPEDEPNASSSSKELRGNTSNLRNKFSAFKVKKWAVDDLNKTLTWLESQEEKPEPSEIRNVAAEGILTCLQDAIDLLDKEQNLQHLTEEWSMVPRVVEELIKGQATGSSFSASKNDLHKQALVCKKIYEKELKEQSDDSNEKIHEPKSKSHNAGKGKHSLTDDIANNSMDYDSDETIEMTEDEINDAYNVLTSKIPRS